MSLPREDEYNQAVQNPKVAFIDADLHTCQVETTALGLPKPYSGGFTTTYKFYNKQNSWAARCFTRDVHDLQKRYQAITGFISQKNSSFFIYAKYLSAGIKVNSKIFPIIKMEWVNGELLNFFIAKNCNNKLVLSKIIEGFEALINELKNSGIAHGDLQGGNIIVQNEKLFLIDYDGMYLPELASLKTNEIGHPNFQHPGRSSAHYNSTIDRFAAIVIYLRVKAVSLKPSLWKKYDNGENILFTKADFIDPQHSSLINEILSIGELNQLAQRFTGVCYLNFQDVPTLHEFLSGSFHYSIPVKTESYSKPNASPPHHFTIIEARALNNLYNKKPPAQPSPAPVTINKPTKTMIDKMVAAWLITLPIIIVGFLLTGRIEREKIKTAERLSNSLTNEQQIKAPFSNSYTTEKQKEELFFQWLLNYDKNRQKLKKRPPLTERQLKDLCPEKLVSIKQVDVTFGTDRGLPFVYASYSEAPFTTIFLLIKDCYTGFDAISDTEQYKDYLYSNNIDTINYMGLRMIEEPWPVSKQVTCGLGDRLLVTLTGQNITWEKLEEMAYVIYAREESFRKAP